MGPGEYGPEPPANGGESDISYMAVNNVCLRNRFTRPIYSKILGLIFCFKSLARPLHTLIETQRYYRVSKLFIVILPYHSAALYQPHERHRGHPHPRGPAPPIRHHKDAVHGLRAGTPHAGPRFARAPDAPVPGSREAGHDLVSQQQHQRGLLTDGGECIKSWALPCYLLLERSGCPPSLRSLVQGSWIAGPQRLPSVPLVRGRVDPVRPDEALDARSAGKGKQGCLSMSLYNILVSMQDRNLTYGLPGGLMGLRLCNVCSRCSYPSSVRPT